MYKLCNSDSAMRPRRKSWTSPSATSPKMQARFCAQMVTKYQPRAIVPVAKTGGFNPGFVLVEGHASHGNSKVGLCHYHAPCPRTERRCEQRLYDSSVLEPAPTNFFSVSTFLRSSPGLSIGVSAMKAAWAS